MHWWNISSRWKCRFSSAPLMVPVARWSPSSGRPVRRIARPSDPSARTPAAAVEIPREVAGGIPIGTPGGNPIPPIPPIPTPPTADTSPMDSPARGGGVEVVVD